jgi:hypothetical protein
MERVQKEEPLAEPHIDARRFVPERPAEAGEAASQRAQVGACLRSIFVTSGRRADRQRDDRNGAGEPDLRAISRMLAAARSGP